MKSVLKKLQQVLAGKTTARIVEKDVQSGQDSLEEFRNLLQKKLPKSKTLVKTTQTIVESALLSEFGEGIKNLSVYPDMVKSITKTLMADKNLKKDTQVIAKKYS